jgi:glycerol-3-phosphate dehydrogenase
VRLPLVGAASPVVLAAVEAPVRLVRRYGTEAVHLVGLARRHPELAEPVVAGVDVTRAELVWGLRHEGAMAVDDLLDRRTRIGLVAADRVAALPAAQQLVDAWAPTD